MKPSIGFCALTVLVSVPALAHAQDGPNNGDNFNRGRNVSVTQRPHPDYDPLGVHVGGFTLFPELDTALSYDDNIFSAAGGKVSDTFATISPRALLVSNWSRNAASLSAYSSSSEYFKEGSEDHTDYGVSGTGRLDIVRGSDINVAGGYDDLTELRSSIEEVAFFLKPLRYQTYNASINGEKEFNRLRISGTYKWDNFNYSDADVAGGGLLSQEFRNRDEQYYSARADYAISPETALYVTAGGNDVTYNQNTVAVQERNSSGYNVDAGADFDLTNLMRGHLEVGYLDQSFSDKVLFPDLKGVSVSANIDYFLTPLMTVNFHANRSFQSTGVENAAGYTATAGGVRADYELLRNLIVTGKFDYENDKFDGLSQTDDRYSASLAATYLVNRVVGVTASYSYLTQKSSGAAAVPDFNVNQFDLKLTFKY